MSDKLERIIKFYPAWDKRNSDPKKDYGVHGVEMKWLLKGKKGVIQFLVFTNWQLKHVQEEIDTRSDFHVPVLYKPIPADIGYHSPIPMDEDQEAMGSCEFLNGKQCYYDGSTIGADRIFNILIEKGDEAVWEELEKEYDYRFKG